MSYDSELAQFHAETAPLEAAAAAAYSERQEGLRQAMLSVARFARQSPHYPHHVVRTDDVMTLDGRELAFRVYRRARQTGATPALLYAHGGGWVIGSIETHDALCAEMAYRMGHTIISLQYRRAPENPFPAAHDDMWAAWQWLIRHAASLQIDPSRIALGGDSAGGHLALGCAIRYSLEEPGFTPAHGLFLWYPNTERCADTESRKAFAQGFGLTTDTMDYFWSCYEGDTAHDPQHPVLYPGHQAALKRLPPTLIVSAEFDLLRDEAEQFGQRLQTTGTPVSIIRAADMPHGFARLYLESQAAFHWVRKGCRAFVELVAG